MITGSVSRYQDAACSSYCTVVSDLDRSQTFVMCAAAAYRQDCDQVSGGRQAPVGSRRPVGTSTHTHTRTCTSRDVVKSICSANQGTSHHV
jgi:hypothetical protein